MEAIIIIVVVVALAALIYTYILSSRAKKDLFINVAVPEGRSVQDLIQDANRSLPNGWVPVGAKKGHMSTLAEWAETDSGGNLLNIATGNLLAGTYVVSAELSLTSTDEFGRPVDVPFDQAPPQTAYDGHVWVSWASAGQGRLWSPFTSMKVIKAKEYLVERL